MLHLTGPHLWLLSVPHLSSGLFSVHLGCSVCDTHFPSQCRVVVVILCFFRPLLSLCRSLLAFSVSVTASFVNVIADYNTEATMSAWARVCMCVCVCDMRVQMQVTWTHPCVSCVRSCMCLWVYLRACVAVCVSSLQLCTHAWPPLDSSCCCHWRLLPTAIQDKAHKLTNNLKQHFFSFFPFLSRHNNGSPICAVRPINE